MVKNNRFRDLQMFSTDFINELKSILNDKENISTLKKELQISSITIENQDNQIQFTLESDEELYQLIEALSLYKENEMSIA